MGWVRPGRKAKKVGIGEPTGVTSLRAEAYEVLCETTARVHCILQPFWQSVDLDPATTGWDEVWIGGWGCRFPAFARPEKTRLTDAPSPPPPASAPLESFCPLPSARHGKIDYAAKVLHLRKERCIRPLTGGLCLPQLPLSITTLCLSALRYRD